MTKANEVFTPNDIPTFTYVDRSERKFEEQLLDAFDLPKIVVSISGPSKSGKTVLIRKVVKADNLIPLSGASIRKLEDLWAKTLSWMDVPTETNISTTESIDGKVGAQMSGETGIPFVAKGSIQGNATVGASTSDSQSKKFQKDPLQKVIAEIAGSDFVLFIDDFHYIPKEIQHDIGKQIKEASEAGVKICTASVPHRADDVVRSNTELRGRVKAIDIPYWTETELAQIARNGFNALNMDISPTIERRITTEAFGSPQLMQTICLNVCLQQQIRETLPNQKRIDIDENAIVDILERTSSFMDFASLIEALHAGPKLRGNERKIFNFSDNSRGDVYRSVLLAITSDPPRLAFNYDEMLRRVKQVCLGESPVGSSISQALVQMHTIAESMQPTARVIEWDENVLDIVDPYFLFFIRSAQNLSNLGKLAH